MKKKEYVIKTYFQEEKKENSFPEYFFSLMYNTIVPTGCALLALDTNNLFARWFFITCFLALSISQFRVKIR